MSKKRLSEPNECEICFVRYRLSWYLPTPGESCPSYSWTCSFEMICFLFASTLDPMLKDGRSFMFERAFFLPVSTGTL